MEGAVPDAGPVGFVARYDAASLASRAVQYIKQFRVRRLLPVRTRRATIIEENISDGNGVRIWYNDFAWSSLSNRLGTSPRSVTMHIPDFFHTYPGMYVAQSFCHAVIAAVITDRAMKAWKIYDPVIRQRFRLIVILFPIFSFPLYQVINPDRSLAPFRLEALFDVNRWINMEIWGIFPLGLLFLILLIGTALIFFFQEMIPVLRHSLGSKITEHEGRQRESDPFIENASRSLSIDTPEVFIIDDDEPVLFSTTGKQPVIFVSAGLTGALTGDQMQAALAHEIAHIARSRRPLLIAVFVLRVIMFFNPVVLIKFRRAVRDEEKICDDIAVSLTHDPKALAEALKIFYQKPEDLHGSDQGKLPAFTSALEEYSHNLHLESRISRLEQGLTESHEGETFPFVVTLLVVAVLNYFVV